MIKIEPARRLPAFGTLAPVVQQPGTITTTQSSPATTALIFGGVFVIFGGFLALQFYKASKGIQDTYVVSGHGGHHGGHGPSLHFDF